MPLCQICSTRSAVICRDCVRETIDKGLEIVRCKGGGGGPLSPQGQGQDDKGEEEGEEEEEVTIVKKEVVIASPSVAKVEPRCTPDALGSLKRAQVDGLRLLFGIERPAPDSLRLKGVLFREPLSALPDDHMLALCQGVMEIVAAWEQIHLLSVCEWDVGRARVRVLDGDYESICSEECLVRILRLLKPGMGSVLDIDKLFID